MASPSSPLSIICLAGATGTGKTAMAIEAALELGCEIINTDSRQVYADFPIITAQPTAAEKAAVPHHLYGFMSASKKLDAASWSVLALKRATEISARDKIPLFVGGTGFYFQALLHGLSAIPAISPEISYAINKKIETSGPEAMHRELASVDERLAAKIHPHDRQRIQRALEVFAATGRTLSWWHENFPPQPLCSGPLLVAWQPLANLESILAARINQMIGMGAFEEAAAAFVKYPAPGLPGWSGIGCAELRAFMEGSIDLETCKRRWFANTRAYAKRQITWFRGRPEAIRIPAGDARVMLETIKRHI